MDKDHLKEQLTQLRKRGQVEALTISFVNSYINNANEVLAATIAAEIFTDVPISISSEVIPEMQEYERAETTVLNSYVRPQVSSYVNNLQSNLEKSLGSDVQLSILRSDGGLASSRSTGGLSS